MHIRIGIWGLQTDKMLMDTIDAYMMRLRSVRPGLAVDHGALRHVHVPRESEN